MNTGEVTGLLAAWRGGDPEALGSLFDEVFAELRKMARGKFRSERSDHTLQPTAVVNEVYLKFRESDRVDWKNRSYFFAACAEMMRRILIDHARRRKAERHGGGADHLTLDNLDEKVSLKEPPRIEILAFEQALSRLEKLSTRQAKIVELRFFGGLTIEETAEVLGVSPTIIKRDWKLARIFLNHELGPV